MLAGVVETAVFDERVLGFGRVESGNRPADLGAVGSVDGDSDGRPGLALLLGDVAAGRPRLLLDCFDLAAGVEQLPVEPLLQGAEFGEALSRRQVGSVFDCGRVPAACHPGDVLTSDTRS